MLKGLIKIYTFTWNQMKIEVITDKLDDIYYNKHTIELFYVIKRR